MKKVKETIPVNEQTAAAKYFAMSNTCTLDMSHSKNIHQRYATAEQNLFSEIGEGLDGEYKMWLKDIQKGDSYCFEQWNKVKIDFEF